MDNYYDTSLQANDFMDDLPADSFDLTAQTSENAQDAMDPPGFGFQANVHMYSAFDSYPVSSPAGMRTLNIQAGDYSSTTTAEPWQPALPPVERGVTLSNEPGLEHEEAALQSHGADVALPLTQGSEQLGVANPQPNMPFQAWPDPSTSSILDSQVSPVQWPPGNVNSMGVPAVEEIESLWAFNEPQDATQKDICPYCHQLKAKLKRHIDEVHYKVHRHPCQLFLAPGKPCKQRFKRREALQKHQQDDPHYTGEDQMAVGPSTILTLQPLTQLPSSEDRSANDSDLSGQLNDEEAMAAKDARPGSHRSEEKHSSRSEERKADSSKGAARRNTKWG